MRLNIKPTTLNNIMLSREPNLNTKSNIYQKNKNRRESRMMLSLVKRTWLPSRRPMYLIGHFLTSNTIWISRELNPSSSMTTQVRENCNKFKTQQKMLLGERLMEVVKKNSLGIIKCLQKTIWPSSLKSTRLSLKRLSGQMLYTQNLTSKSNLKWIMVSKLSNSLRKYSRLNSSIRILKLMRSMYTMNMDNTTS